MTQPARSRPMLRLIPAGEQRRTPDDGDLTQAGQSGTKQDPSRSADPEPRVPSSTSVSSVGALAALSDGELVGLGAQGSRNALEVLYRRHAAFAIHLATRIEGSAQDVDDVVHDAFIKAFERLSDLSDPNAFRSWLGSIVVHDVRSRLRRTKLMRTLGLIRAREPIELDAVASVEASPHVRAQLAQVYALLRTQPVDERISWILRAVEGHDLQTVARLTACSLATAKRRISRVQSFLDEHFVESCVERGES